MICLKDHGSTSDVGWDIEILKMWNAKKNIKGGTLENKISVEKRKWKVLQIAWFGEKSWKKVVKNLTAAAGEKKKSKKYKKLDNCTKWRDLKFYCARTNGLEDIQVRN